MKRSTLALAVIMVLVLGLATACGSRSRSVKRTISSAPTRRSRPRPIWPTSLSAVSTDGSSASQALTANSVVMRRVIAVTKKEGVAQRDIQTQE